MEAKARAVRGAVYLATALYLILSTTTARAEERGPVVIGEVATRVTRARVDLPAALRRALEREIAALHVVGTKRSKRYVLSASIVKLEQRHAGAAGGVECAVSAVLREGRSGAIRAILTGRAEAEQDGEDAELMVLDAAVRGAVSSVPSAVR
jgi:hypothetical protein